MITLDDALTDVKALGFDTAPGTCQALVRQIPVEFREHWWSNHVASGRVRTPVG